METSGRTDFIDLLRMLAETSYVLFADPGGFVEYEIKQPFLTGLARFVCHSDRTPGYHNA